MSEALARLLSERPDLAETFPKSVFVALADLLFPSVVEYRGGLVDERQLELHKHLESWAIERAEVEYVLNHIHFLEVAANRAVFPDPGVVDGREADLATLTAEVWRWWLPQQTSTPTQVWFADDPDEYGPTVGFGLVRAS